MLRFMSRNNHNGRRVRFGAPAALLLALAIVMGGAIFPTDPIHAQGDDNDYVDVAVMLEAPETITAGLTHELNIIVVNRGARTAYDVEVVVNVVSPELSMFRTFPRVGAIGHSMSLENDGRTLRWSIPALGGLQREEVVARVTHKTTGSQTPLYDNSDLPHELSGEVTTSSFESNVHQENNTDRVWTYQYTRFQNSFREVLGNYSVGVAVDNPTPSPGDTVNFTITADRTNPYHGSEGRWSTPPPFDLKVDIELTDGLSVDNTGTITYGPATDRADSVTYSDGVFTIGTVPRGKSRTNSVTLPITVASGSVVNEQCLTARLTGKPPPGFGPGDDDASDNVAKVCLGSASAGEQVLFTSGQSDLFTWYDCSEETSGPCDSSVSLEMVALGGTAAEASIFQPDDVVVHIPDPAGRATSSDPNSGSLVWSTGFQHPGSDPDRPGIIVRDNSSRLDIETTDDNDQWGVLDSTNTYQIGNLKMEVTGPGEVSTWYHGTSNVPTSFHGSGTDEAIYDDIWYVGYDWSIYNIWLEFATLGTYTVKQTIKAMYDDDTTDTTDPTEYTDTETYTFHVGPTVDLSVADGGASPDVATDQYAITISAENNGPDYAEADAEVTVNLSLPAGVTSAEPIASDGTYSNGTWDLGALKTADHRSSAGETEAATLTFILAGDDAANATATATIANGATNYTVCISSGRSTLAPTNQTDCQSDAFTTNVWYAEVCVNTADGEIDSTITVEATCDSTTDRAWTEDVCASSGGNVRANRDETECGGWFQGTVYDYNSGNNTVTITAQAGTGGKEVVPIVPSAVEAGITVTWEAVETLNGVPVKHYQVERQTNPWEMIADNVVGTEYVDTDGPRRGNVPVPGAGGERGGHGGTAVPSFRADQS